MKLRDALLGLSAMCLLTCLQPARSQDNPPAAPELCTCLQSNWPLDNSWNPNAPKGNPGQHLQTGNVEVWTHGCVKGGTDLDVIMLKLFARSSTQSPSRSAVSAGSNVTISSVSIYDSPAVPDLGGHSILGGLLTGKGLTAILPNLAVCVVPTASGRRTCTALCKPGHQCLAQPFVTPVQRNAKNSTFYVSILDVDRPGSIHNIITFKIDPTQCTTNNHCTVAVPDTATYGNNAKVEFSFESAPQYCNPDQAHVIQFISSEVCNGSTCSAATTLQSGLPSYDQGGCIKTRKFGAWYLDAPDCNSPFLNPEKEMFCNGQLCGKTLAEVPNGTYVRLVDDEPSVAYQPAGSTRVYRLQRHVVDFAMCGKQVRDVVEWTRTGDGQAFCDNHFRTSTSIYQVQAVTNLESIKAGVCHVEAEIENAPAMADPAYLAVRKHVCGPHKTR